MEDIEFDILPNGEVRFLRTDMDGNKVTIDILSEITNDAGQLASIKNFLGKAENIEKIFGDRSFCG